MGGGSYSKDFYDDRAAARAATGAPVFTHDHDIRAGRVSAGIHPSLDIRGKIRESRDSVEHPNSTALAVVFDETGSMGEVPVIMQQELPKLMGLLLTKGYLEDPQVLCGAVGDARNPHGERAPIQIGQFESDLRMEDNLTNIFIEKQGGGSFEESYILPLYYFAHRTSCDCFEKRGKKGYLFLVGDETTYPKLIQAEAEKWLGVALEDDVPLEAVIAAVKEKWEVFFIIPNMTSNYGDPRLEAFWKKFFGQNVIRLEDPHAICEVIGATVGIWEGRATADSLATDLKDVGSTDAVVYATTTATSAIAADRALARVGEGGSFAIETARSDKNERL